MLIHVLLVAHIAVLGYWLGSELVINNVYRYVSFSSAMPFDERSRLMERVMDVDQHVRYALVLQAGLGFMLAALYGYVPGRWHSAGVAALLAAIWLVFVEATHRLRHRPAGRALATIDRSSRYVLMALLFALAAGLTGSDWPVPFWLRLKLAAFACVIICGVGIRLALIRHFRTWAVMASDGPTPETNAIIKRTCVQATLVLVGLWVFIAMIVALSVLKPSGGA